MLRTPLPSLPSTNTTARSASMEVRYYNLDMRSIVAIHFEHSESRIDGP